MIDRDLINGLAEEAHDYLDRGFMNDAAEAFETAANACRKMAKGGDGALDPERDLKFARENEFGEDQ